MQGEILHSPAICDEARKQVMQIKWLPPPHDVFKLNTDGSHKQGSHLSACGGLIRNSSSSFIAGFHCNMGVSTSVVVELWALVHGLKLAHILNINKLIVETDLEVVVNMIIMKQSHSLLYQAPS